MSCFSVVFDEAVYTQCWHQWCCHHLNTEIAQLHIRGGGGTQIIFWQGCAARGLKPLPISKNFSPSKTADLTTFFEIFANRDPFLRVFYLKNSWFFNFFCSFCKMGLSSKDFLTKMGSSSTQQNSSCSHCAVTILSSTRNLVEGYKTVYLCHLDSYTVTVCNGYLVSSHAVTVSCLLGA